MNPEMIISGVIGFLFAVFVVLPISRRSLILALEKEKTDSAGKQKKMEESEKRLTEELREIQGKLAQTGRDIQALETRLKDEKSSRSLIEDKIQYLENEKNQLHHQLIGVIENLKNEEKKNSDLKILNHRLQEDIEQVKKDKIESEISLAHFKDQLRQRESQCHDLRLAMEKLDHELEIAHKELRNEALKRSIAEEKLFKIPVLEKEIQEYRDELVSLKTINERLSFQEKQIQEIKAAYTTEMKEKATEKYQKFAGQIYEVKVGLEKAIDAFNRTIGMVDQRYLVSIRPGEDSTMFSSEKGNLKKLESDSDIVDADHSPSNDDSTGQ